MVLCLTCLPNPDPGAMLAAGRTVAQVVQSPGVSEQISHRWRTPWGGMKADEMRRLKEPEVDHMRLKKALADLTIDNQIVKGTNDYMRKHSPRRGRGAS